MTIFKSIKAWVSRRITEESTMPDETNNSNAAYFDPLSSPVASAVEKALAPAGDALAGELATVVETALVAAVPAPAAPIVAAVLNTDVLKSVLLALGHDLGPVWDDAVALAKKAL